MENNSIDFSTMSDAEIDAVYEEKVLKVKTAPNFDEMTDVEVDRLYDEQVTAKYGEPSFLGELGGDIMKVADTVDSYTGAPTREALKTLGESESLLKAGGAFIDQFGEDTSTAATGKEVARSMGVRDFKTLGGAYAAGNTPEEIQASLQEMPIEEQIAPANVPVEAGTGMAIDMLADPLIIIPVGKVLKYSGKTIGKGLKTGGTIAINSSDLAESGAKLAKGAYESGERAIQNITRNLKQSLKPERVKDWTRIRNILKENDLIKKIDDAPEALEFGEHSNIGTSAKVVRDGPYGEGRREAFQSFLNNVDGAVKTKINNISPSGAAMDTLEAGNHLIDSYNNGVVRFFDQMEVTYQNINSIIPDITISDDSMLKLYNTLIKGQEKAKKLAASGFGNQTSQAKQLFKDLETAGNVSSNYQDFLYTMKNLGKEAFSSTKALDEVPVDKKVLREIYFDMRDIIYKEVKAIDPNAAKSLRDSNKKFSKFFNEQSAVGKIIARGGSGENLFKRLIVNGNDKDVKALRSVLNKTEMDEVRASILNEILSINKDTKRITFNSSIEALANRRHVIAELFRDSPDQLREVTELLEVGSRAGAASLNPSGTSRSQRFVNWFKELASSGVEEEAIEVGKKVARNRTRTNRLKKIGKDPQGSKLKRKRSPKFKKSDVKAGLLGTAGLSRIIKEHKEDKATKPKTRK